MTSYGALLVAISAFFSSQAFESGEKVKLDVYYESLCCGCEYFVTRQLRPTAISLKGHIDVNLVPYGNAKTIRKGDNVTFKCAFGESECLLNKIHACSFKRIGNHDNLKRVLVAACLFDNNESPPLIAGEKCASKFGLKWTDVSECAKGAEGTILEDAYGNETNSLNPPIPWAPYFAVDKYRGNEDYQSRVEDDLKNVLCETLAKKKETPEACK